MSEAEMRSAIVAEALSWERTPYIDRARIKGVGCDCVQLPCAVYGPQGVDLIPDLKPAYSSQHMIHCDEGDEYYLDEIRRFAREIDFAELQAGDLVVWKFGRVFSHSAIVIDLPIVVHSAKKGGGVFRMNIDQDEDYREGRRLRRAFSIFDEHGELYWKAKI